MSEWFLASWQRFSSEQLPIYSDLKKLRQVVETLTTLNPLVTLAEIRQLKQHIKQACYQKSFILQGGDCAESFAECSEQVVANKLSLLKQMGEILRPSLQRSLVYVGRIAGQYTKPRSSGIETQNQVCLPSYRGDLVNGSTFDPVIRVADPNRMLVGYQHASMTLKHIGTVLKKFPQETFYTSHEALHLYYEQALTRQSSDGKWYNSSTHFPWIGMRTAFLDSPQVEFLRGLDNPLGIKISADMQAERLVQLIKQLNPLEEEGRVVLITRLGSQQVEHCLPRLIQAVNKLHSPVAWFCDPMHGNTELTNEGIKTRHFNVMLEELLKTVAIHSALGSHLSGIHLELTGEDVTECLGGPQQFVSKDLKRSYKSLVDPRLNELQSLEMAKRLAKMLNCPVKHS